MSRARSAVDLPAVDRAIDRGSERAFAFLERLIVADSTVGREAAAQRVVTDELAGLGFRVRRVAVPSSIGRDEVAGVPQAPYRGRSNVLGRMGPRRGRSLLLNGHIDVVPAGTPRLWSSPPFVPRRRRGWMFGRGAGDMKGGFAMATLAVAAVLEAAPRAVRGPLAFLSVIEEECTGNGTLAAGRAGVLADAVVLPEPTDLQLLVAGIGILWVEIEVVGRSAHAESADRAVNPIDEAIRVIEALRDLEREMNQRTREPAMREVPHPYNVNVGVIEAGDWLSSVPPVARLGVRVGFPTAWGPARAEERVRRAVARAARRDPWLRAHPPIVRATGFRAEGHALAADHPLVEALATAHAAAHGSRPGTVGMGSTTDARFYLNQFDIPALCYGPRVRNIHGVDEAVELQSIVDGARTMARFLIDWYADVAGG